MKLLFENSEIFSFSFPDKYGEDFLVVINKKDLDDEDGYYRRKIGDFWSMGKRDVEAGSFIYDEVNKFLKNRK